MEKFKTNVVKSPNGFQVSFSIGVQTFFLQEQTQDQLDEDEKISVKEYSEWYEKILIKALKKL